MATITLTLDDVTLERLRAGEPLTLTATLREKKVKKSEPLPESLVGPHRTVVELWAKYQPDVSPALAWKAIKPIAENPLVLDAMALALDWNEGRKYLPSWFVKDVGAFSQHVLQDMFAQEAAREAYRKRVGLT